MKEYLERIENDDEHRVTVKTRNGKVILSTDCGVEAFDVKLSNKDIDKLISMLKKAKKCANNGSL